MDRQIRNIDFKMVRDIRRQTNNFQFPQMMFKSTAVTLNADRLASGRDRNFNVDLFCQINAVKINMQDMFKNGMKGL